MSTLSSQPNYCSCTGKICIDNNISKTCILVFEQYIKLEIYQIKAKVMVGYEICNRENKFLFVCSLIGIDAFCTISMGKEKFVTAVREKTRAPEWQEQCDM